MPIPSYQEIVGLLKTGLTIEAQEKIMELRTAALALEEENLNLRKRVTALEHDLAISAELVFQGGIYWRLVQGGRDGPFCQVCYDKDKKLTRLQDGMKRPTQSTWVCLVCSTPYV